MRNNKTNSILKQLDDIRDLLAENGMTHYIEQAYNAIQHAQACLEDYKTSSQLETKTIKEISKNV